MNYHSLSKFFVTLSAVCVIASMILLIVPGPKLSIDFSGGTLMEILPPPGTTKDQIEQALGSATLDVPLGNVAVSQTKGGSVLLRSRDLTNDEHTALIEHLESVLGTIQEDQFTTIGPTVGESLKQRAVWSLVIASAAIIVYLAFAFRKVPRRLSPWKFGVIAVGSLLHDIIITVGVFIVMSHFTTFEIDTLFITALLIILGYSVNDTIIVFDRMRDNAMNSKGESIAVLAERSVRDSLTRSCYTSFSTLIVLFALFFFGSESIRWFVLTLIVGISLGTYSSIFIAMPLLVYWKNESGNKNG